MAGSVAVAAIARLRRLAPVLAHGGPDQQWLATAIERYLLGARAGLNLDSAIGVAVAPGSSAWWNEERHAERDRLLREIAASFPGRTNARAVELQRRLKHYASVCWPRDRRSGAPTAANEKLHAVFVVDPDPPMGIRRLTEILSE